MDTISVNRFRDNLKAVVEQVVSKHEPLKVTRRAGEDFVITWYWKCLASTPGSWKMFVHIDGNGNRVHGDHEPIEDRYPVRLWDVGDIIIDRQELTVPGNYRPGDYTIFIGLFAGNTRMAITDGPTASEDRVRAGILTVR